VTKTEAKLMQYKELSEDHVKAAIASYLRSYFSGAVIDVLELEIKDKGMFGVTFRSERKVK